MQDTNYITIQGWMRTQLHLMGNELFVYAIIYGFSQDGETRFTGSRQYLADWCGCTVRCVQTALNNLVNKGLITKYEELRKNIKFCSYVANFTTSEKFSPPVKETANDDVANFTTSEKFSLNNTSNTITSNNNSILVSNDTNTIINENSKKEKRNVAEIDDFEGHAYTENDFLKSVKKKTTKKRGLTLYDKCIIEIDKYTDKKDIKDKLIEYLKFRLEVKDKPLYGISQWKSLLTKLDTVVQETKIEYVDIIQQSIDKGWLSFYAITKRKKEVFSEYGEVNCEKNYSEEDLVDEEF